jgi:hypothetical protein
MKNMKLELGVAVVYPVKLNMQNHLLKENLVQLLQNRLAWIGTV